MSEAKQTTEQKQRCALLISLSKKMADADEVKAESAKMEMLALYPTVLAWAESGVPCAQYALSLVRVNEREHWMEKAVSGGDPDAMLARADELREKGDLARAANFYEKILNQDNTFLIDQVQKTLKSDECLAWLTYRQLNATPLSSSFDRFLHKEMTATPELDAAVVSPSI